MTITPLTDRDSSPLPGVALPCGVEDPIVTEARAMLLTRYASGDVLKMLAAALAGLDDLSVTICRLRGEADADADLKAFVYYIDHATDISAGEVSRIIDFAQGQMERAKRAEALSAVSPPLEKGLEEFPGPVEPSAPDSLAKDVKRALELLGKAARATSDTEQWQHIRDASETLTDVFHALQPPKAADEKSGETVEPPGWPSPGDKMWFLGKNGYDQELSAAKEAFTVGQEFTVEDISIGDWSHSIKFEHVPGRWNGVMFSRLPPREGTEG